MIDQARWADRKGGYIIRKPDLEKLLKMGAMLVRDVTVFIMIQRLRFMAVDVCLRFLSLPFS